MPRAPVPRQHEGDQESNPTQTNRSLRGSDPLNLILDTLSHKFPFAIGSVFFSYTPKNSREGFHRLWLCLCAAGREGFGGLLFFDLNSVDPGIGGGGEVVWGMTV